VSSLAHESESGDPLRTGVVVVSVSVVVESVKVVTLVAVAVVAVMVSSKKE
jgi:hypothetical protein